MIPNFYTLNCPKCLVLEKKLKAKDIQFNKITNFDTSAFIEMGYDKMPLLEVESGVFMEYKDAVNWVNAR